MKQALVATFNEKRTPTSRKKCNWTSYNDAKSMTDTSVFVSEKYSKNLNF